MTKTTFEEILDSKGELIYSNVGDSMSPLIRPGDLLIIKKHSGPLKKYDVPLYKRDSGQYVLHRVIKTRGGYVMCGDNRYQKETGITDRHILGILTAIVRGGETLPLDAPEFRRYEKTLPRRRARLALRALSGRVKSLIKKGRSTK